MRWKNAFTLTLMFLMLVLSSCQHQTITEPQPDYPPESEAVQEDGSLPPGFKSVLTMAGIPFGCITCNSQNRYGEGLSDYAKTCASQLWHDLSAYLTPMESKQRHELLDMMEDYSMWCMVRAVLIEGNNNNLGGILLKDRFWTDDKGKRHPVVVFRAAFTPSPERDNSCYRSLLACGRVRHVLNLYDGEMHVDDLIAGERKVAQELGASYCLAAEKDYGPWRDTVRRHPASHPEYGKAMASVARLIKEQILMPNGAPPRGNILIHCGGGMHRTGMVVGILQKVINRASRQEIERSYRYHTGYRNPDSPGGFEQGNLDFIFAFDRDLLD